MEIDFNDAIHKRTALLNNRISELNEILPSLKIPKGIEFAISKIWNEERLTQRKERENVGHDKLNFLKDIKKPVVYIFEIISNLQDKGDLIDKLKAFRSKENTDDNGSDLRRASSKITNTQKSHKGNILYVGSIKKGLAKRVREHLGLGHKNTYALQLKHWAPPNLKLRFYYIELNNENMTIDVEAAIATQLNPLVGETGKIAFSK